MDSQPLTVSGIHPVQLKEPLPSDCDSGGSSGERNTCGRTNRKIDGQQHSSHSQNNVLSKQIAEENQKQKHRRVYTNPSAVLVFWVVGARALPGWVNGAHGDDPLEAFERPRHQAAVGPRARVGHVQVVAPGCGGVFRIRARFDHVAEGCVRAHERPFRADFVKG